MDFREGKREKRKEKRDDLDDQWTSSEELGFFLLIPSTRPPALSVCLIVFVLFTPEKCEISFKTEKQKRRILVLFFFLCVFSFITNSWPAALAEFWSDFTSPPYNHLSPNFTSLANCGFFHFKAKKKREKSSTK
jgi:hypothetical protein